MMLSLDRYIADAGPIGFSGLALDSRHIRPGDLFIAVSGHVMDGLTFAAQAAGRGAVAVITDSDSEAETELPVFRVTDLISLVAEICQEVYFHGEQSIKLTGVTGTNGKTSICQYIAQMQSALSQRCAYIGTNGKGIWPELTPVNNTTPDIVSNYEALSAFASKGAVAAAVEVSSHGLDQRRMAGIRFRTGVFTNLTRDHLDYHHTLEAYGAAKRRLFTEYGIETAVINIDDDFGRQLADTLEGVSLLTYSAEGNTSADLYAADIEYLPDSIRFELCSDVHRLPVNLPLIGQFNIANALAAAGSMLAEGTEFAQLPVLLENLQPTTGRMQTVSAGQKTVVVDYAHTSDALEKALIAARQHCNGSVWVVFGCGGDRDKGKRPLMAAAAEQFSDHVVVTDDNPRSERSEDIIRDVMTGFSDQFRNSVIVKADRREAIIAALSSAAAGDMIVVAGKGHEDYQIIGDRKLHFSDQEVISGYMSEAGNA